MNPALESFEIRVFRGLSSVSLAGLGRLNLLVGANNSGKTSILEALAIFATPFDIDEWANIVRLREVRAPMSVGEGLSIISNSKCDCEEVKWQ